MLHAHLHVLVRVVPCEVEWTNLDKAAELQLSCSTPRSMKLHAHLHLLIGWCPVKSRGQITVRLLCCSIHTAPQLPQAQLNALVRVVPCNVEWPIVDQQLST
jgi:hypothetical protein